MIHLAQIRVDFCSSVCSYATTIFTCSSGCHRQIDAVVWYRTRLAVWLIQHVSNSRRYGRNSSSSSMPCRALLEHARISIARPGIVNTICSTRLPLFLHSSLCSRPLRRMSTLHWARTTTEVHIYTILA